MRFSAKTAAVALLAGAYAASAFLVLQHKAKAGGAARVTLRICHWQLETGVREAIDAVIRRYEQIHPNIRVEQIAIPGGGPGASTYTSWVLTQMAGGRGPDLVEYDGMKPDVGQLFQPFGAEVVKPNPYNRGTSLEGVPWKDTFVDDMLTTSYDRNLDDYYAIAMYVNVNRILYDRPLMKAVTGRDAPPRTYRELLALCAQIRSYAAAHHLVLAPMASPPDATLGMCWNITTNMTNHLSERIDFQHRLMLEPDDLGQTYLQGDWSYDTPDAVAAFQEVKEFGEMSTAGFLSRGRDDAVTDFVCGRAVMMAAPTWQATNVLGLCNFPVGAFPYPYPLKDDPVYGRFAEGPFSDGPLVPGMPFYLSRATKHRAEALDFLKFLSSQEGGTIFSRYSNWQSAVVGVKPSPFAAQFQHISEGYYWNAVLFVPSGKVDAQQFLHTHIADLWAPNEGVDAFRAAMREGMGDRIRSDLKQEILSSSDYLRNLDAEAAAQVVQDAPGHHVRALPLMPSRIEGILYQNEVLVDPPPPAGAIGLQPAALSRAAQGPPPPEDADRESRFRAALEAFEKHEPFENGLDEVSRSLTGLADSGSDDVASGSRFFLGRIAQHHRTPVENAEAARQFSLLVSENPRSYWAQEALAPLALLDMYGLDLASPPAARIARAQALIPLAESPQARSELNMAIAYAILFYRLPAGQALPSLLTVERMRLLDGPTRADVLVQIAELSRLAGERAQAARFYRAFLAENPADDRVYLVRQRLAALAH